MHSPVRVLHAVVNMNRGGAETLIMNLYRNVDRTRLQFDFLTCKPGSFDEEIEALGGTIHRLPYITDTGHFGYIRALEQFFASHKQYRIVHAHMDKMSGLVLRAAKKNGVPVRIAHSHNTSSEGGFTAKLYKWLVGNVIATSATHLFACSEAAADWMYARRSTRATILQNGIDCTKFDFNQSIRREVRRELRITDDTFVVGHVGRFAAQKNHSFLLEAYKQFQAAVPNSVLLLAGDGPLRAEMENKAKALGLAERIRFLGVRSDIERLLQAFDVFVFPSLHEGLPVTIIEAQGAGLPCVLSDRITPEVDMGMGLVWFFPLTNPQRCIELMKEVHRREQERSSSGEALGLKGYNIKQTAKWAEAFYAAAMR